MGQVIRERRPVRRVITKSKRRERGVLTFAMNKGKEAAGQIVIDLREGGSSNSLPRKRASYLGYSSPMLPEYV